MRFHVECPNRCHGTLEVWGVLSYFMWPAIHGLEDERNTKRFGTCKTCGGRLREAGR